MPTLLRIALLVLYTPPFEPLDVLLSYSHLNLQNDAFEQFLPIFRQRARIPQFVAASPINMGLLSPSPPSWHPATPEIREAARRANEVCNRAGWDGGLPNIALGFAYRKSREMDVPMVVGLSRPHEVHENVKVWREIQEESEADIKARTACEKAVVDEFEGTRGLSWASP